MRMLVVDDEQLVRWFLGRALRKNGHEVIIASNVSEAIEKLGTEKFDMMFIDLRMPEGNGTELIAKVWTLAVKPKVVVCSAFISSDLEEEFKNKGIFTLKKPFKLDELNIVVQKCLNL
jgi:DNA-binding NtrC family response regulator